MTTFEWRLLYPVAKFQTLFFYSDHRPILFEFGTTSQHQSQKEPICHFETHWGTETDCMAIFKQVWIKGETLLSLPERIRDVKYHSENGLDKD